MLKDHVSAAQITGHRARTKCRVTPAADPSSLQLVTGDIGGRFPLAHARGSESLLPYRDRDSLRKNTGQPLPDGHGSVSMIEQNHTLSEP